MIMQNIKPKWTDVWRFYHFPNRTIILISFLHDIIRFLLNGITLSLFFSASSASFASFFISYRSVFNSIEVRSPLWDKKRYFLVLSSPTSPSSTNNIFSYEIIFDLNKKISTHFGYGIEWPSDTPKGD